MPWGAIDLLARTELRRRWRSLVALAVLAGVAGAAVVGALAVARRTSTAPERLREATAPGDARAVVYGNDAVARAIAARPEVERSWTAAFGVGRVEDLDTVQFVGVLAGPERPDGLLTPVLVAGRHPDPDDPREVLVTEFSSAGLGAGPGDRLRLTMLTAEEVAQFDSGFGEPDGPELDLEIVGVMRLPDGVADSAPVLGTPALFAEHGDEIDAGTGVWLDLADGSFPALRRAVDEINETTPRPEGAEEFPTVDLFDPVAGDATPVATARVLVTGLVVAAAVAGLAGLLALGQAAARHHASGAAAQEVEAALGLTAGERVLARVAPAIPAALLAGLLAGAGGLAAGRIDPAGALRRVEPRPGWAPNVALALGGGAVVSLVVLGVVALTARRALAGRRAATRPAVAVALAGLARRAPALVGLRFALDPGRGRARVPVRFSLAGAVCGVAGVVAAFTFGASVDRLVGSPARWGWTADLNVVDATDEIAAELAADPRVGAVTMVDQGFVSLGGRGVSAMTERPVDGLVGWTILDGRRPASAREVVLGTRVARSLGLDVGDHVDGLRVVGVGIGPSLSGEHLGDVVLLTAEGFDARRRTTPFTNALVRAAPGVSGAALTEELAARYEVGARAAPDEVRNLAELGNLPAALGGFLAVLAAAALAHALVVTTRRRAGDLAVLRAIGFTPRQAGASLVVMALATAGVGVLVGAPLGALVGRLVWWAVARQAGAGTDPSIPVAGIALLGLAFAAGAVVVALVPAWRAARLRPAALLRAE